MSERLRHLQRLLDQGDRTLYHKTIKRLIKRISERMRVKQWIAKDRRNHKAQARPERLSVRYMKAIGLLHQIN